MQIEGQRILVIGHPGAGKSTLSRRLEKVLRLPLTHLDRCFWRSGWVQTERGEFRKFVAELVARDRWIIDGTYDDTLPVRLPRADAVIFLDFPTWLCALRVAKRVLKFWRRTRPDMAEGCRERIDIEFFRYVITFRKQIRPNLISMITEYFSGASLITLKNPSEVAAFVENLEQGAQNS